MFRKFGLKLTFVAAIAVSLMMFAGSCGSECVDKYDCVGKGSAGQEMTCDKGVCKQGSPFAADAGS